MCGRISLCQPPLSVNPLSKLLNIRHQGQNLAVWTMAAKLPNYNFNFAVDFLGGIFATIFSKEKGPKKSTKKSPAKSLATLFGKIPLGSRAAKRGGFKRGGFPIWTCPSFLNFVLFCPFWDFPDFSGIFPICSAMVRGFSRFVLFLFLGLLRAPTRNSPESVRDAIWTFPEKSGKHPGLETPRLSFSQSWFLQTSS